VLNYQGWCAGATAVGSFPKNEWLDFLYIIGNLCFDLFSFLEVLVAHAQRKKKWTSVKLE